jgi:hypothetical protein
MCARMVNVEQYVLRPMQVDVRKSVGCPTESKVMESGCCKYIGHLGLERTETLDEQVQFPLKLHSNDGSAIVNFGRTSLHIADN